MTNNKPYSNTFSAKIMEKIEAEKERRIMRKEVIFQLVYILLSGLLLIVCLFFINKYYFNLDFENIKIKTDNVIADYKAVFCNNFHARWGFIGINILLLSALEQFLSKKISKKLQ